MTLVPYDLLIIFLISGTVLESRIEELEATLKQVRREKGAKNLVVRDFCYYLFTCRSGEDAGSMDIKNASRHLNKLLCDIAGCIQSDAAG